MSHARSTGLWEPRLHRLGAWSAVSTTITTTMETVTAYVNEYLIFT